MRKFLLACFPFLMFACTRDGTNNLPAQVQGFAPVYAGTADITNISFTTGKRTERPGKIYAFKNYIFQSDINKGIHVINNSDKANPVKLAFIQVPFSTEIAVKGNFLYTNNLSDLVVFDISDLTKPVLVKRIANVFPPANQEYPPEPNTAFECVDPSKGTVVGWESKMLIEPKCRR